MKKGIALLASILISDGIAAGINLNVGGCNLEKTVQKQSFGCPCAGGSGDYDWHFSELPEGWKAQKDRIIPSKGKFQQNRVYGTRVQVFDRKSKQSTKKSLFFKFRNGKVGHIVDHDYDFDVTDLVRNGRGRKDQKQLTTLNTGRLQKSQNDYERINSVFEGAQGIGGGNGLSKLRAYFGGAGLYKGDDKNPFRDRLPSNDDVDRIINGNSSKALRQLLVNSARSKVNCKDLGGFMERTFQRLRDKIGHFKDDVQSHKNSLTATTEQLKYLQAQLKQSETQQVNLKLLLSQLQQFKEDSTKLQSYKINLLANLRQANQQIQSLQVDISRQTEIIRKAKDQENSRQQHIVYIDNKIVKLQEQIEQLKRQRAQFSKVTEGSAAVVAEANQKIQNAKAKIKALQIAIGQIKAKIRAAVQDAEVLRVKILEAERILKSSNNQQRSIQIKQKIVEVQRRLQQIRNRVSTIEPVYKDFRGNYDDLQKIRQNNFNVCYKNLFNDDDDEFKEGNNGQVEFQGKENFKKYLHKIYGNRGQKNVRGQSVDRGQSQNNSNQKKQKVRMRRTHILSKDWKEAHGSPFDDKYDQQSGHRFVQNDFNCDISNVMDLGSFKGKVISISKNVARVQTEDGKQCKLYLGGCTRIQAVNKKVPQAGDRIHWKGNQRNTGDYNAHFVTCE